MYQPCSPSDSPPVTSRPPPSTARPTAASAFSRAPSVISGPTWQAWSSGSSTTIRATASQCLADGRVGGLLADHAAGGGALLPGVSHRGAGDDRRGGGGVGVGQHDRGVLAAHLALGGGAAAGQPLGDRAAGALRPCEAERPNQLVADQRRAELAVAVQHLQDALRQQPVEQAGDPVGADGRVLGWLHHADVAVGHRRGELPQRDGQREVPGRDQADDAARHLAGEQQRAAVGRREAGALGVERRGGVEAEDGGRPGDLTPGLGDRLADLAADQRCQLAGLDLEPVGGPAQRLAAGGGSGLRPARRRLGGAADGVVEIDPARRPNAADDVVGARRIRADDLGGDCGQAVLLAHEDDQGKRSQQQGQGEERPPGGCRGLSHGGGVYRLTRRACRLRRTSSPRGRPAWRRTSPGRPS